MTCKHEGIKFHYDVERLSETEGGPVKTFALTGNAFCIACGQEFRAFRVELKRTTPIFGCEHKNFAVGVNVGASHIVSAAVGCYDCGMKFDPVQFRLEPVQAQTEIEIPSDEELERIGKLDAETVH